MVRMIVMEEVMVVVVLVLQVMLIRLMMLLLVVVEWQMMIMMMVMTMLLIRRWNYRWRLKVLIENVFPPEGVIVRCCVSAEKLMLHHLFHCLGILQVLFQLLGINGIRFLECQWRMMRAGNVVAVLECGRLIACRWRIIPIRFRLGRRCRCRGRRCFTQIVIRHFRGHHSIQLGRAMIIGGRVAQMMARFQLDRR